MKDKEIINKWTERRSQIEAPQHFTDNVLDKIYQHEQNKRKPYFDLQPLVEFISAHPLAKAGLITIGAITGLIRVAFMMRTLLVGY